MNDIKEALTRKLGPLPAWAWALIAGTGLYLYRRKGAGGLMGVSGAATGTDVTSPDTSASGDGTNSGDPTTLQPGESVYDPTTHGLVTAPGMPSTDVPDVPQQDEGVTPDPLLVDPGQSVYDPRTPGKLIGPPSPTKKSKKKTTKRAAKPKGAHTKTGKVPHHGTGTTHKSRARSVTKLLSPGRTKGASGGAQKGRTRVNNNGGVSAPTRVRTPVAKAAPVTKQHTAPATTVHPTTQKVTNTPARGRAPAAAPVKSRTPARKRK